MVGVVISLLGALGIGATVVAIGRRLGGDKVAMRVERDAARARWQTFNREYGLERPRLRERG